MSEPITTVSVRRLAILGHTVTDGTLIWETAAVNPPPMWGVIVNSGDGGACGLAPDEESARRAAEAMCREHGWTLITTGSGAVN